MSNTAERIRAHAKDDHARGCAGRTYSCKCGYDMKTEGLLFEAADELTHLHLELAMWQDRCMAERQAHEATIKHADKEQP